MKRRQRVENRFFSKNEISSTYLNFIKSKDSMQRHLKKNLKASSDEITSSFKLTKNRHDCATQFYTVILIKYNGKRIWT